MDTGVRKSQLRFLHTAAHLAKSSETDTFVDAKDCLTKAECQCKEQDSICLVARCVFPGRTESARLIR